MPQESQSGDLKIDFWGLPGDDWMDCEEIEEIVERYVADYEVAEEEITICGHVRTEIKKDRLVNWLLSNLIEHMDEEYTVEEGNMKIANIPAVRVAALKLVDAIIANGYKVEALDKVCEKKIKISDYIEKEKTC